jgi:ferredoxin-NADP reductase
MAATEISTRIIEIAPVTHNVRRYRLERPEGYAFEPGQATEVSLDEEGWRQKKHPFTFTALPDAPYLEFTIKSYFNTGGAGVTERLYGYGPGDRLILRDVWGTITYKGPGTFIAGGAGVTPFIAILRHLEQQGKLEGHRLIASNRTEKDIILRDEFEAMAGLETIWTVTDDPDADGVLHERIDEEFFRRHLRDVPQHVYLCGPDPMVKDLKAALGSIGAQADSVVFEK